MTLRITRWLPRRRAPEARQPGAAQDLFVAGLGAGGDLDLALLVERGDGDRGAEHRLGGGDRDDADQVGAVALEALVLGDLDLDVEVARRAHRPRRRDRRRRPAAAGHSRSRPGFRPRASAARGCDRCRAHSAQGVSGILPAPPQASQATALDHLPERGARDPAQLAGAVAFLAGGDRRPRLGAVAVAVLAGADGVEGDLPPHPGGDLRRGRSRPRRGCRHPLPVRRRRTPKPKAAPPPKSDCRMSSIEPKEEALRGSKPPERRPSWP